MIDDVWEFWGLDTWGPDTWGGDGAAPVVDLRPQDASLLVLRPRKTLDVVGARRTLHRIPHRKTVDDGGPT